MSANEQQIIDTLAKFSWNGNRVTGLNPNTPLTITYSFLDSRPPIIPENMAIYGWKVLAPLSTSIALAALARHKKTFSTWLRRLGQR